MYLCASISICMLQTIDLTFQYKGGHPFVFPDLTVGAKESMLLLGRSGIGKTTLLHLLGGLMQPSKGKILIDGADISHKSGRDLDRFRGKHIGIIFQQNHFIASLNVMDNILLAQTLIGDKANVERANHLLERLSIASKANQPINKLSQGEKQRVAIARAVINKPGLILADEPTSALDDQNCIAVYKLLEEQAVEEGSALVIVTHDNRLKSEVNHQIILQ